MVDKDKLLREYERAFENLKKELGFEVNLDELELEFNIMDYIFEVGFVKVDLFMQISSRIADYYRNWANYLNFLLLPNPGFMPSQTESKLFSSEKDRKEIWEIIKLCMRHSNNYSLMFLNPDKKIKKEFIDNSFKDYREVLKPSMKKIMERVCSAWDKD